MPIRDDVPGSAGLLRQYRMQDADDLGLPVKVAWVKGSVTASTRRCQLLAMFGTDRPIRPPSRSCMRSILSR
jgi:hypothetical protein